MKRWISCIIVLLLLVSTNVSASTLTKKSSNFSRSWSVIAVSNGNQSFVYGYNTTWINEDTVSGYSANSDYKLVINNTRVHVKHGKKGQSQTLQVKHSGNTVTYQFVY